MQPLVYHVAASLDGFLAQPDGSFDGFAWDDEVVADFERACATYGTVLMGRKTYEVGLAEGKTSPYPSMRQVVFSRSMTQSPDAAVELVGGDIAPFVRSAKETAERPLWLCGGGEVAAQLLDAGLVDRVVVKLNPVVFGAGVPLFAAGIRTASLRLEGLERFACGITVLQFAVPGREVVR
ncbi:MAG: dihydrofolate reductase family protein [Planctomycetota bacterium]